MIELSKNEIICRRVAGNIKIISFRYDEFNEITFEMHKDSLNAVIYNVQKETDHFLSLSNFTDKCLKLVNDEMKKMD